MILRDEEIHHIPDNKGMYFSFNGVFERILTNYSKMYYPACTKCKKKAYETADGYTCDACGINFDEPRYIYTYTAKIQDPTGSILARAF